METGMSRSSAEGLVPPGFVSRTAFSLKRMTSIADNEKCVTLKDASRLEDYVLKVDLQIKHRAWIVHDQLDHHEEEPNDRPSHETIATTTEGCLPKGSIWGCPACSNCLKVSAQGDPEGACSVELEEAPVFRPTDEEFKDTDKYIESICQQVKSYGLCRIVPPPSWQPPCSLGNANTCKGLKFTTHLQRINGLQNCGKRKRLASKNGENLKSRRVSKLDADNESETGVTPRFAPHYTLEHFKENADYFKQCYFKKKSRGVNIKASYVTRHEQWEPSEVDIEGEYWRILEKPSVEIEVLHPTNLDSFRTRVLESFKTETSNSMVYQESGWNLSNLSRLPGSLLSFEISDCLGDLAPQFHIGMCFSTLPWEVSEHHLYTLCYLHLGAPKVWYGAPGHYLSKFQAAVNKHFPGIYSPSPELLHKPAVQVSPSTLQAEGIPIYRCIQRPKEFILFLPGAYHTGFDCGFNVSESASYAPLDWLPHGLSVAELYREKKMKQLICHDELLFRAAHEAVKACWEGLLLKGSKTHSISRWKLACRKGGVIAETLKVRVKAEVQQRKCLCTDAQSRKMKNALNKGARKQCCICKSHLYLSAAFCPCSPNKYACLKHAKSLCLCAWSEKVFLHMYTISELNLLVEASEGKISACQTWVRESHGKALDYDSSLEREDGSSTDNTFEYEGETGTPPLEGANVKEKLLETIMAHILEASIGSSKSKMRLHDFGSSPSDDERSHQHFAECHSASSARASGSSKAGHEKPEMKSSGKPEPAVIYLTSSDDEV